MLNETLVYFGKSREITTTALYQYDYGQLLIIKDIELPRTFEVHFCNEGDAITVTTVGGQEGILIPDSFLLTGKTILAYFYLHEGPSDGKTEYKIRIPVIARPEPKDIEPTPVEQSTISQLMTAMNDAVEITDANAEIAVQSANGARQSSENAEAWAVGERNGEAVDQNDETYQNNAKFYAHMAEQAITGAGWAWFDVEDSNGCMWVTVTKNIEQDLPVWRVNEQIGILEVMY